MNVYLYQGQGQGQAKGKSSAGNNQQPRPDMYNFDINACSIVNFNDEAKSDDISGAGTIEQAELKDNKNNDNSGAGTMDQHQLQQEIQSSTAAPNNDDNKQVPKEAFAGAKQENDYQYDDEDDDEDDGEWVVKRYKAGAESDMDLCGNITDFSIIDQ